MQYSQGRGDSGPGITYDVARRGLLLASGKQAAATKLAASGNTANGTPVRVRLAGTCGGWHAPGNNNKAEIKPSSNHKGELRWVLKWTDKTSRSQQRVTWPADVEYAKHKRVTKCGRKWEVMWG